MFAPGASGLVGPQGLKRLKQPFKHPFNACFACPASLRTKTKANLTSKGSRKPSFQSQLDVQGLPKTSFQGQLDVQGPLKPLYFRRFSRLQRAYDTTHNTKG